MLAIRDRERHGIRVRTAVSLDEDTLSWVNAQVGAARRFHNLSHAIDTAFSVLRKNDEMVAEVATLRAKVLDLEARLDELRRRAGK